MKIAFLMLSYTCSSNVIITESIRQQSYTNENRMVSYKYYRKKIYFVIVNLVFVSCIGLSIILPRLKNVGLFVTKIICLVIHCFQHRTELMEMCRKNKIKTYSIRIKKRNIFQDHSPANFQSVSTELSLFNKISFIISN